MSHCFVLVCFIGGGVGSGVFWHYSSLLSQGTLYSPPFFSFSLLLPNCQGYLLPLFIWDCVWIRFDLQRQVADCIWLASWGLLMLRSRYVLADGSLGPPSSQILPIRDPRKLRSQVQSRAASFMKTSHFWSWVPRVPLRWRTPTNRKGSS